MLAVQQHGIPVEQLGLGPGSPLLASLKQKVRWIICWLCAAAWRPRGAAGSGAGESATRLTQAEGEIDFWRAAYIGFEKGCTLQALFQIRNYCDFFKAVDSWFH
jgi:hypothetical protein